MIQYLHDVSPRELLSKLTKLSEAAKLKIDLTQEASSRHSSIHVGSCFFAEMKWNYPFSLLGHAGFERRFCIGDSPQATTFRSHMKSRAIRTSSLIATLEIA